MVLILLIPNVFIKCVVLSIILKYLLFFNKRVQNKGCRMSCFYYYRFYFYIQLIINILYNFRKCVALYKLYVETKFLSFKYLSQCLHVNFVICDQRLYEVNIS